MVNGKFWKIFSVYKYFFLAFMVLLWQVSLAEEGAYSGCRFDESSLEIFGLAAYRYAKLKERSTKEKKEFSGWYLFLWKSSDTEESLIEKQFQVDSTGSAFNSVYQFLKNNSARFVAYALVWEDDSQRTKFGRSATILRINAGFSEGAGYDVFLDAKNINAEGAEIGCGVNFLKLSRL